MIKRDMTFEEIIFHRNYEEFRIHALSKEKVKTLIRISAHPKGITWFTPFMRVREKLPIQLLEPILLAGIRVGDVSYPKKWMPTVKRIYSPEVIDQAIFNLLHRSPIDQKCKIVRLCYWNKVSRIINQNKENEIIAEFEVKHIWDNDYKSYREEYIKIDPQKMAKRREEFRINRYNFLLSDFLKTENIIYRYFMSFELPRAVEKYPFAQRATAAKVLELIHHNSFPTSVEQLKDMVNGDVQLEKILYSKMKWTQ